MGKPAHSLGYTSARFGPCEVCNEHVVDVWIGALFGGRDHVFGHQRCVLAKVGECPPEPEEEQP